MIRQLETIDPGLDRWVSLTRLQVPGNKMPHTLPRLVQRVSVNMLGTAQRHERGTAPKTHHLVKHSDDAC